jgi:RNA polymerase sigma-70 factor (ECF subfamily)
MIATIAATSLRVVPGEPAPEDAVAQLVARARSGDRRAFDELYRAHVFAAHRLLTRLIGPVPEREDLLQQAFLAAFRALRSFRNDAGFATWLHRILCRVAYRHLRQRGRVRWEDLSEHDVASADSPELAARHHEDLERALLYLAALKPKKRIAYVLRVVEGLSLEKIGNLVGARAAAVGQRVKHAQRELAAMIARDELRRKGAP